ncbi:MAG: C25 family cysteine peptidase [Bacteroidales bacterium]|nr:C25 family cysteine peptidase [Bacteroidales bacterium]
MFKFTLKRLLVVLLFAVTTGAFAQDRVLTLSNNSETQNETVLMYQNDNATTIRFTLNEMALIEVNTDDGTAYIPMTEKAPLMLEAESPEIFYLTTTFIIPDRGNSVLEIFYSTFTDFDNIEIAPSKGNLPRSINPETVPYVKGDVYFQDKFFPETLAGLREPFIMRDVRGQSLDVYPVQYNPVTKVLRVYSEITVTVRFTADEGINEFTDQKRHATIDPQFSEMYKGLFLNHSVIETRGYPTEEIGELLIICHNDNNWVAAMQPYVDWKRTIGRKTTLVTTAVTGTTAAAIKTYITNYYNDPANDLAYVLLVGDSQQIPPSMVGSIASDINYVKIKSGNYLDVLIGRFSAETVAHVQTQVQRSIWYERDTKTSDSWLQAGIGLAANEGAGGGHSGEADYVHINNIRNKMLTYGYNPVHQEYTWNCPGVPNTTLAQISSRFNSGAGVANYCNHGFVSGWALSISYYSTMDYTSTHVNQLQNAGKLPYIFSVACSNGKFNGQFCFAEAWLRASQGGNPTGAIATFMATIDISWVPPMTAQDEFTHICLDLGPYQGQAAGTKRTIAGAMLNASQKMIAIHGNNGMNDYNSWLVFGDPTLMFRTKTPQAMTVTHPSSINTNSLTISCDANDALVALTYVKNNEVIILGTAIVAGGTATIEFNPAGLTGPLQLKLAVTGFNKVTYIGNLTLTGIVELFPPQNLDYTVEKANHVILDWDAPKEGKDITVTGYNVYRDEVSITAEPVKERTYTDIVPANGEYKYNVTAIYDNDKNMESEKSNTVTVTIDGMCIAIEAPVLEQIEGEYSILVSWEAPEYEGTELLGYNVYRNEEQINEEIVTELNFLDEDLEPEVEYCYTVGVVYADCEDPIMTEAECMTMERVSITEFAGNNTFQIFPNPAHDKLNIVGEIVPTCVRIYNITGQLMYENTQCTTNMNITISTMPTGVYFIKIDSEYGTITKKIIFN